MERKKVGVIGLGHIGAGIAKNLLKNGFDVTVYDIRREQANELEKLGATFSDSCSKLASASEIVFSVVRDDLETEEVLHGNKGVWAGIRQGSTIVISSTIDPKHCQRIEAEGIEKGVRVLDAPVSGGKTGSDAGTLTLMIGGDKATFEQCSPVFEVIGKKIFYLGKSGMGEVFKIVNNLILFINLAALSEGIGLGLKAGIELEPLLEVLEVSSGGSNLVRDWNVVKAHTREYRQCKQGSAWELLYKDIGLALKIARDMEVYMPFSALCSQMDISEFFKEVDLS